jgi:hypothetical protein
MIEYINGRLHISCSTNKCTHIAIVYRKDPNGYTDDKIYYCATHYLNRCKEPVTVRPLKDQI